MTIAPHENLHTGLSVWQSRPLQALAHEPLRKDLVADVLVVGAGISGALVAESLSDAGLGVVVADRRRPVTGATSASTALIQYDLDLPLVLLAERIGADLATRVWQRVRLAMDALCQRARHLGIHARFERHDSLYLDGNLLNPRGLAREAEARRRAGFELALLEPPEVERYVGIKGRTAILSFDQLAADPRRLTTDFLRAAASRRARIVSPADVTAVSADASGVSAQTSGGPTIRARHLVFATGYEVPEGVPQTGHSTASTWAIATRRQPRNLWSGRCMIWEASDPYLYVRTGLGGRVICGGEDEPFTDQAARDALMPEKTRRLEARLAALFPGLDPRADYAWCGTFGLSELGLPSIGAVPGMPNCYAVLGYGGNGITFSALGAQLLRNQIVGNGDADADLFAF
jgi:glycine/D-amino acid oxidase-like deaminating enzyme